MKKIILLILVTILYTNVSRAQTFNLGIKAGVNLAELKTDFAKQDNVLGYQAGVWTRIGFGGFYIQPEAYIGNKGSKFISFTNNNNTEVTAEGTAKFTMLDVPLLLGTKVGAKNYNIRFMAGPVLSFVLNDQSTFSSAYDQATDFKNYKNQTLGLQGGLGLDVSSISIDVRYEAGLSNISNSEKYIQKPNLWHVSLGFKIL